MENSNKLFWAADSIDNLEMKFKDLINHSQAKTRTLKANVALTSAAASISYAKAIANLSLTGNSKPANTLLRSLLENSITLNYLLRSKSDTRIKVAELHDLEGRVDALKHLKKFMKEKK